MAKYTLEERQAWRERRLRSTEEVVAVCASNPAIQPHARIVGSWVWVEFPNKPERGVLAWLRFEGFHWSQTRQAWQHPCGVFRPHARSHDPRSTFGQVPIDITDTSGHDDRIFDQQAERIGLL